MGGGRGSKKKGEDNDGGGFLKGEKPTARHGKKGKASSPSSRAGGGSEPRQLAGFNTPTPRKKKKSVGGVKRRDRSKLHTIKKKR